MKCLINKIKRYAGFVKYRALIKYLTYKVIVTANVIHNINSLQNTADAKIMREKYKKIL